MPSIRPRRLWLKSAWQLLHKIGLLDDSEFDGFRLRMASLLAMTGFRAMWSELRLFHGPEFREFFDALARTAVVPASANALERWQQSLAAARVAVP